MDGGWSRTRVLPPIVKRIRLPKDRLLPGILIRLETKIALGRTSLRYTVGNTLYLFRRSEVENLSRNVRYNQDYVTKCEFLQRVRLNFEDVLRCGDGRTRGERGSSNRARRIPSIRRRRIFWQIASMFPRYRGVSRGNYINPETRICYPVNG